ncbi:MAG: hypothetical protein ABSE84_00905 [Isosphaeraceae bacterium]
MDPVPQITRIFRCREGFALVGGGGFRTGELVFEDHPAVREFPTRFEPDVIDPEALLQPPAHLLQRARRVHLPETPPSWWVHISEGAA